MQRFANPLRFKRLSGALLPWTSAATVLLFAAGLWLALAASPADYQQGQTVRIMYVHVPAAWMAMFVYANLAVASAIALVWRHRLAEVAARAMAPMGACFTALCLATGSLWGKPMWGTWWVWDARLTSTLILLFLYLGTLALWSAIEDTRRGDRAGALLTLFGVVNVPIILFSVVWWNTLHQGSSIGVTHAPRMATVMMAGVLTMTAAAWAYAIAVTLARARRIILERERKTEWVQRILAQEA